LKYVDEDEVQRFAGLALIGRAQAKNLMQINSPLPPEMFSDEGVMGTEFKIVAKTDAMFKPNPTPEAVQANKLLEAMAMIHMGQQVGMMKDDPTEFFSQVRGISSYSNLLRAASGVLEDPRDFIVAMKGLGDSLPKPADETSASDWEFKKVGSVFTAINRGGPQGNALSQSYELRLTGQGDWRITKLISDDELLGIVMLLTGTSQPTPGEATIEAVDIDVHAPSQTDGKDDAPKVGEVILLKLTGDVAREYVKETGQFRGNEKPPAGLEIDTSATITHRLGDGRLRIEHLSPPRVVFTDNWITMLMATVDPSAISRETTPRGTVVKSSPDATSESMTNEESHSFRMTLSNIDDVILKILVEPLPAKEAALSDLQFKRTAATLNHLLQLNGDGTTHIQKVGFHTNVMGIKDVEEIRSHGKDYVAVAARRFPPEVKQPFGQDGDGMIFLFDKKGNLEAKFGGNLGPDGMNAERVQLLSLGTDAQWFVAIRVSEPRSPLKKTQRIYLVEDGFPLAFQIHAIETMAWTDRPYENDDFGYKHFFNPGGIPNHEFGKGRDGKDYHAILGWEAKERVFRGPSQLTYTDKLLFRIDLTSLTRFRAVDRPRDDQASEGKKADPSGGKSQSLPPPSPFGMSRRFMYEDGLSSKKFTIAKVDGVYDRHSGCQI